MDNKFVITIGRQFGSGGREVGKKIAKDLGIEFYDKELITLAAKKYGMNEKVFESVDERPTNSLLYSLAMGAYGMDGTYSYWGDISMPLNDRVYQIQANLILELSEKSSCVIVGRCADYVLRKNSFCFNAFLYADLEFRANKAISEYDVPKDKVYDVIKKTDKKRGNYYNFHTNRAWGDFTNYHMVIDCGFLGLDESADLIEQAVKSKFK